MIDNKTDKWNGSKYSKNSSLQYDYAIQCLNEQKLKRNEIILDVGCGDGKITSEIASRVPDGEVVGIDASESMIEEAQKIKRPNLKFMLKNVEDLNFIDQFDLATSFFCLQWVPNKLAAFKGIATALQPGGRLVVIVPLVGRLPEITNEIMIAPQWEKYFRGSVDPLATARDTHYDTYAKQAGFELTTYQKMPITVHYPSREALFNWLFVITPHLIKLPSEDAKHAFIEDAIQKYLTELPQKEDSNSDISYYAEFTLIKMIGNALF